EITSMDARELSALLTTGEVSAREVVSAHLDRIEAVNPDINAVVTLCPERALDEADEADRKLSSGAETGPLHGIPIAHKDTHETAGLRTTFGSPLFAEHVPERDELVVERMRAAGAITIGKTNVPEFAMGSHTFNPVFGTTRNPHDTGRSAGGSSGGAAAALACGMTPLAEGSDMGGSLRNPASFCGVVGLRPSPGRVPSWPDVLGWQTMSVQGPMARTVADCALLLSVLAGPDPRSPIALGEPGAGFAGPLECDVRGLRVAWAPDLGGRVPVDPSVTATLERAVRAIADTGCAVRPDCPNLDGADEVFRTLRAAQLGYGFAEHLDVVKPSLAENARAGLALSAADVMRAEARHTELFDRVREFFTRYDILLAPVSQVPPFPAELEYPAEVAGQAMHDYLDWMRSAYLISATGCPALSLPAGFTEDGLPIGLQVIGPHRAEAALLRAAHAFEAALGGAPGVVRG
ncbi:amidase, partial [Sciscionella sediminilitoris]|uniref:amidase n=1 Tax=Sciscionella sediminilitoris TaxID=1445613 RepID=UPI0004DFB5A0